MPDETLRAVVLDGLEAAHERWRRLVADVGDRVEEPGPMGDWTFKDLAAHLTTWRRRTIDRLEAAARGLPEPPASWPAELGEAEDDVINGWIHDRTKDRPAAELLAEADRAYIDLAAAIAALPLDAVADPSRLPWLEGIALGPTTFGGHLDEHEPSVRAWLADG